VRQRLSFDQNTRVNTGKMLLRLDGSSAINDNFHVVMSRNPVRTALSKCDPIYVVSELWPCATRYASWRDAISLRANAAVPHAAVLAVVPPMGVEEAVRQFSPASCSHS
jgi:hypothetical protein